MGKGRRGGETNGESRLDTCAMACETARGAAAIQHKELSRVLRNELGV